MPMALNTIPNDAMEPDTTLTNSFTTTSTDNSSPTTEPPKLPSSFPLFPTLPKPLRLKIWSFASPPARTHFLEIYHYTAHLNKLPKIRYIPALPALFHTSQESRTFIIQEQGGEIVRFAAQEEEEEEEEEFYSGEEEGMLSTSITKEPPPIHPSFYFNFTHDILFLSSRFTHPQISTETFKLLALSNLLPQSDVARLRRVAVTYSSMDSYEHIGAVLRAFVQLETLYLVVMDWWSRRSVRRRLRRGRPALGVEAGRILRRVVEAGGEEEEGDEDKKKRERIGNGKKKRILEVELRLDE